jgi:type III pantothenate kinase
MEVALEALTERAAKLPKVELVEPRALVGKSTVDAIRAGVIYGYAGQVDGIVGRLRGEMGEDTPTIATGGLAHLVVTHTATIDTVDDLLTLEGLRLIHDLNTADR